MLDWYSKFSGLLTNAANSKSTSTWAWGGATFRGAFRSVLKQNWLKLNGLTQNELKLNGLQRNGLK